MLTTEQMDALVDGHYRAEEAGDIGAIVDGFVGGAEHDVAGRPGGPLRGDAQIAAYYRELLSQLRIERFEPVRRRHGPAHVVDESILHATAVGRVFGLDGGGRAVQVRLLHVFDFDDGLIGRESAWLDVAGLQRQLSAPPPARLVDPAQAPALDVLGPTVRYLVDGDPCVLLGTIPPGGVVPLHSHADPETFVVRGGRLEGLAASSWVALEPGDIFHVPPHARHAWRNPAAEPAETLIVTTARLGRFFREVGVPAGARRRPLADDDLRHFLEVSERYGYWNATPAENAAVGIVLE